MKECLNLGCGTSIKKTTPKERWCNIDRLDYPGVDRIIELDKPPWNLKSNHFDHILASHILEHLSSPIINIFQEISRILKEGGTLEIIIPHRSNPSFFSENHKKFFWLYSFVDRANCHDIETKKAFKDFILIKRNIGFHKIFMISWIFEKIFNCTKRMQQLYEFSILCFLFPAKEITVILRKQRGGYAR